MEIEASKILLSKKCWFEVKIQQNRFVHWVEGSQLNVY